MSSSDQSGPATDETEAADATAEAATTGSDDLPKLSPAVLATAIALPVMLIVGVLVMAVLARQHPGREPLALGSAPAPQADSANCHTLLPLLPDSLGSYTRSELAQPAPAAAAAWQQADGGEAIVLRCGLERPQEFTKAAGLQVIDTVNWFQVRDPNTGANAGTWYVVDRGTYIAVTLPDSAGPTALQTVSDLITKNLPAQPMDPAPIPN
ncbi:DUF3515 domain-containing protein [Nocardia stercoris]|uniref:DUF3515 domain-containing protein n=1 Tax=Nocardia stercoris TaxID=2483361 RepID=A0A3M2LHN3_9NOCA|nr:DUF3515 domain-containing protein [Nocardia stercoris]RMI35515.1 DUF3515 domain-containing protein [Nocardia stercoris]